MFPSPVPPTFSLKTQGSRAGLTCRDKSASSSNHRESCPNTQLGLERLPVPSAWGRLPPPVVFTLRSPIKSPPIYLSFLPGMSALAKVLCPSLLFLHPCHGESPAAKVPCPSGVCSARGCCSCPGCPWLSPGPRAQQLSWGLLWHEFVLQGENAMRNRVHCVIAQTSGGFFIKVVVG